MTADGAWLPPWWPGHHRHRRSGSAAQLSRLPALAAWSGGDEGWLDASLFPKQPFPLQDQQQQHKPLRQPQQRQQQQRRSRVSGLRDAALSPLCATAPVGVTSRQASQLAGRAVLLLSGIGPSGTADAAIAFPPGLRLTATTKGRLDLQLRLVDISAAWYAPGAAGAAVCDEASFTGDKGSSGSRSCSGGGAVRWPELSLLPPRVPAAAWVTRAGALTLMQVLFPERAAGLLACLSIPGAAADVGAAVWAAAARRQRSRGSDHGLPVVLDSGRAAASTADTDCSSSESKSGSNGALRRARGAAAAAAGALHALAGPATALLAAGWLWSALHPDSLAVAKAVIALVAVSAEYQQLGRQVASGRVARGRAAEAAWRRLHKRAAQQVAPLLGDLPPSPPLGAALDFLDRVSVLAGTAVSATAFSGSGGGFAGGFAPGDCWWLGGGGAAAGLAGNIFSSSSGGGGGSSGSGGGFIGPQPGGSTVGLSLVVAASLAPPRRVADAEASSQLSRDQLITLFYGPEAAPQLPAPRRGALAPVSAVVANNSSAVVAGGGGEDAASEAASSVGASAVAAELCLKEPPCGAAPCSVCKPVSASGTKPSSSLGGGSGDSGSGAEVFAAAAAGAAAGGGPVDAQAACDPLAFLKDLPLYGLADHATSSSGTDSGSSSSSSTALVPRWGAAAADSVVLAARAAQLMVLFAPFLLLGIPLLLLAALLSARANTSTATAAAAGPTAHGSTPSRSTHAGATAAATAEAAAVQPPPASVLAMRRSAWRLLLWSCSVAGPSWIKWVQWSSSRRDLFADDFIEVMGALQDRAPTHSPAYSRRAVRAALSGRDPSEVFESFEAKAVASGSIAQVHRATLRAPGAPGPPFPVAIKVRHPNVATLLSLDFHLLSILAAAAGKVRALRGLSLRQSVAQFTATMTAQCDLRVEAVHALRFADAFGCLRSHVAVPRPVPGLATADVYAMEWMEGRGVAGYMREPTPLNTEIVALGVDTYVKMLLNDNFVHTDLHPGNIMVSIAPWGRGPADDGTGFGNAAAEAAAPDPSPPRLPAGPCGAAGAAAGGQEERHRARLILLDFGLAEELTPEVRYRFISFLNQIAAGDGRAAARHLLHWTRDQGCPDPSAFEAGMVELFETHADVYSSGGIDLNAVLQGVLVLARRHQVSIDSCYASLVMSVCVITGFAVALDPEVNVMDAAAPALLAYALTGRVFGRLYS